MKYISSKDQNKGAEDLADTIIARLHEGKKVLWILTGGSTIPSSAVTLNKIKSEAKDLSALTVTLTDERYGEVGHADSSWQRLIDSGFDFESVNTIPVIKGLSFEETAHRWEKSLGEAFASSDAVVSQFGVGSDMHIAGILPGSPALRDHGLVSYYKSGPFDRITLTFESIKKIQSAYVFVFGESKKDVITELRSSDTDVTIKPANILKSIPEVFVYSDQI